MESLENCGAQDGSSENVSPKGGEKLTEELRNVCLESARLQLSVIAKNKVV
jgi:hypothetical protein